MSEQARDQRLRGYFSYAVTATLLVLGTPLVAVMWLEASGQVTSTLGSIILGVILSFGTASLGSVLWMRFSRSSDLVFADLMLWGWLRRYFLAKRIMRSATLLAGVGAGSSGAKLSLARQSRMLNKLASSLESADPYTHGHSRRVARHAYMMAKRMGLDRGESALIRAAAAIHDVGKLDVPVAVLHKPGRLTEEEFAQIKRHPVAGAEMVSMLGNERLTAIVHHHHERLDGGGYPHGLSGNQIPMGARIIAVADTFDAITSARPYRPAARHKKAIEIIRKEAGTQLDPHVVEAFLHYYGGRRSITLWALLTSAPHRALEAITSLLRKTVSEGLRNAVSASAAALIVGSTVLVAGTQLQPRASDNFATSTPLSSTTVLSSVVAPSDNVPQLSFEGDRDGGRSTERAHRPGAASPDKGSDPLTPDGEIKPGSEPDGDSTSKDSNPSQVQDSDSGSRSSRGSGEGTGGDNVAFSGQEGDEGGGDDDDEDGDEGDGGGDDDDDDDDDDDGDDDDDDDDDDGGGDDDDDDDEEDDD